MQNYMKLLWASLRSPINCWKWIKLRLVRPRIISCHRTPRNVQPSVTPEILIIHKKITSPRLKKVTQNTYPHGNAYKASQYPDTTEELRVTWNIYQTWIRFSKYITSDVYYHYVMKTKTQVRANWESALLPFLDNLRPTKACLRAVLTRTHY